ncbi:MAG: DUF4442 domain-containing protein [Saprospiraceae bacterium]|nr:DUF4442 domain-containing protein [Saprospiraceae bacterium]
MINNDKAVNELLSWKFRMYLLFKMPAAIFMRIRVHQLNADVAEVVVPFSWRTQNPFKSIYFAAQTAAAELSTGVLMLLHLNANKNASLLVTAMEGKFYKKANQKITFRCENGQQIREAIAIALKDKKPFSMKAETKGYLPNGEIASSFIFEWSVLVK